MGGKRQYGRKMIALLTNSEIAELLAIEAENTESPFAKKALKKASRKALSWDIEAADLRKESRSFTELPSVGPYIDKKKSAVV